MDPLEVFRKSKIFDFQPALMDKHSKLKDSNSKALNMMSAMSIGTAVPLLNDIESNVIAAPLNIMWPRQGCVKLMVQLVCLFTRNN